jgi:hypothetical protein
MWIAVVVAAVVVAAGGAFAAVKMTSHDAPVAVAPEPPPNTAPIAAVPKEAAIEIEDEPKPGRERSHVGTLAVTVEGSRDATILVDGKVWGQSNQTQIQMLEPGEHLVIAKLKGKEVARQNVTIAATEVSKVTLVVPVPKVTAQRPVIRKPPPKQPPQPPPQNDLLTPKGMRK